MMIIIFIMLKRLKRNRICVCSFQNLLLYKLPIFEFTDSLKLVIFFFWILIDHWYHLIPAEKRNLFPPFTRKKHVLSHCCCAEEKTLKHTTKTLKKTYEAPKKEERIHFIHFCPFDVTYTIIVNAHEKKTNVIKIWWCRNDGIILSLF